MVICRFRFDNRFARRDCFAYNRIKNDCNALSKLDCKDCKFYKTADNVKRKEKFQEYLIKVKHNFEMDLAIENNKKITLENKTGIDQNKYYIKGKIKVVTDLIKLNEGGFLFK